MVLFVHGRGGVVMQGPAKIYPAQTVAELIALNGKPCSLRICLLLLTWWREDGRQILRDFILKSHLKTNKRTLEAGFELSICRQWI